MKKTIIILCIILSGCAASKGGYQEIRIDSNIIGAKVELDGAEIGRTPFAGKVKINGVKKIKVSKDGYGFSDIAIEKKKRGGTIFGAGELEKLSSGFQGCRGCEGIVYSAGYSTLAVIAAGYTTTFAGAMIGTGAIAGSSGYNPTAAAVAGGIAMISMELVSLYSEGDKKSASWEYSPSQYYAQFKEEGASDMDFVYDTAIRYFATVNHSQIAIDSDGGEYAGALCDIMGAKKGRESSKRDIYEALEESKGSQAAFGDALVARFRR